MKIIEYLYVTQQRRFGNVWRLLIREKVRSRSPKWICLLHSMKPLTMKEREPIKEMHTRFTAITNKLHWIGEVIPPSKEVREYLVFYLIYGKAKSILSWRLETLRLLKWMNVLVIWSYMNWKTQQDQENKEPKKEKILALKSSKPDSSEYDDDVAYLAWGFIRAMKKW